MKTTVYLLIATLMGVVALFAEEFPQEGTQKIILKFSTVETVGTRTEKTWNPPAMPMILEGEAPFNAQEIATADPMDARDMTRANHQWRLKNQRIQAAIALRAYEDATEHYKAVKAQLEGTTFGRQVILALDKFTGIACEHLDADCIEFFHRMDLDEASKEAFLKDMSSTDLVTAPYFLKLVFDDPRVESGKTNLEGQTIKMTKIIQTISYSIQDLSGKVITAGNVKKEKTNRSTNAVITTGTNESMLIDVMEEALVEVAKKINHFFVTKNSIKLIGPKHDDEFDADSAIIEIDGTQYDAGEEFSILKGRHTVTVELDGYKQKGSTTISFKKDGTIKVSLTKDAPKKEMQEEE